MLWPPRLDDQESSRWWFPNKPFCRTSKPRLPSCTRRNEQIHSRLCNEAVGGYAGIRASWPYARVTDHQSASEAATFRRAAECIFQLSFLATGIIVRVAAL